MLKEHHRIVHNCQKTLDVGLTALAFILAYFTKNYGLPAPYRGLATLPNYYTILLLAMILSYITFNYYNLYASQRTRPQKEILLELMRAVFMFFALLSLALYLLKIPHVSRLMMAIFFFYELLFLLAARWIGWRFLRGYRQKGFNYREILIIGSRMGAHDVIDAVTAEDWTGFHLTGCLSDDPAELGKEIKNGVRVVGVYGDLETILLERVVDEMIFSAPLDAVPRADTYIAMAESVGVRVRVLPQWRLRKLGYTPQIGRLAVDDFLGIPTLTLTTTSTQFGQLFLKSLFDYVVATLMLIPTLPLFMLIAVAIKLASPGPILFRQERVGLNGRRFMLYKFRTMVPDAERRRCDLDCLNESDGPVFKIKNDPRIIPVIGHFLRKTSLDELPQLLNVMKGEMSLIGPRPPIPAEVVRYDVWQRRRLSVKPGLTCTWQTAARRNDIPFEDWMKLDLKYIDNWCLKLDFYIFFKTTWVMLTGRGR